MHTPDTWIEFGRALEQIRGHERRITQTETGLADLNTRVEALRSYGFRALLLALLWTAGLGGNWSAETVGETLAATIKAMRK